MSPPRKKEPPGDDAGGPGNTLRWDGDNDAATIHAAAPLLQAFADLIAERAARRTVDLLRAGADSQHYDQHDSPLGNRRHCRLIREGKIPGAKVGRRYIARKCDVDAYIHGDEQPEPQPEDDVDDALAAELGLRVVK